MQTPRDEALTRNDRAGDYSAASEAGDNETRVGKASFPRRPRSRIATRALNGTGIDLARLATAMKRRRGSLRDLHVEIHFQQRWILAG
jgi:hypothetical protein